jgi:hypothetical protein
MADEHEQQERRGVFRSLLDDPIIGDALIQILVWGSLLAVSAYISYLHRPAPPTLSQRQKEPTLDAIVADAVQAGARTIDVTSSAGSVHVRRLDVSGHEVKGGVLREGKRQRPALRRIQRGHVAALAAGQRGCRKELAAGRQVSVCAGGKTALDHVTIVLDDS